MPVGSGDGVGDCDDAANFQEKRLLISLVFYFGREDFTFFLGKVFFSLLLDMLVAKREPTPCYHDAYSVGTPKWTIGEKGWQKHGETTVSPFVGRFFLVSKRTITFGRASFMGSLYW